MRPEHLLEQADLLLDLNRGGQPRQADKRRAVSTAYYAVFHQVLREAADRFAQGLSWDSYTLVYRSVDHRRLKQTCEAALGRGWTVPPIDPHLAAFCTRLPRLGELRNRADYDPSYRITRGDARDAVTDARSAIHDFTATARDQKIVFLTLLAFQRRS